MTRRQVFTLCFFAAFAFLLFQIALIFKPFLFPMLWALILAHLVMPLHVRLAHLLKGRESASAAILTAQARRDPRIRILSAPRRGLVAALNALQAHA